jgi:hypothetical protein
MPDMSYSVLAGAMLVATIALPLCVAATPFFIVHDLCKVAYKGCKDVKNYRKNKAARKLAKEQKLIDEENKLKEYNENQRRAFIRCTEIFYKFINNELEVLTPQDMPSDLAFLQAYKDIPLDKFRTLCIPYRYDLYKFRDFYYYKERSYDTWLLS